MGTSLQAEVEMSLQAGVEMSLQAGVEMSLQAEVEMSLQAGVEMSFQAGVLRSMLGRAVSREGRPTARRPTLEPAQAMRYPPGAPAQSPFRSLGLLSGMGNGTNRLGQGRKGWSRAHLRR